MGTFSIYVTVLTCTCIQLLPSDAEYTNFKNFANICHHRDDLGLDCEWNFFVTSHGKNTCYGIRGKVKQPAALAQAFKVHWKGRSCQWDSCLTGVCVCVCNIQHIIFFFITAADIDRFVSARAIPGTRANHSFVPLSHTDMKVSRVSIRWRSSLHGQATWMSQLSKVAQACLSSQAHMLHPCMMDTGG